MAVTASGQFKHVLTHLVEDIDEGEWTEGGTIRAHVQAMKGREEIRHARAAGVGAVEVTVRQNAETLAITTSDRLRNERNGHIYKIQHIVDLHGDGRELLLTCVQHG